MIKVVLKWIGYHCLDRLMIPLYIIAPWFVAIFTRPEPDTDNHNWGGWFGTYDNPPQGDERWQREGWFPGITTGFKGYLNRVGWMYRNPGYNLAKKLSINYEKGDVVAVKGNPDISDKYEIPGWYFARCYNKDGVLKGFELYVVYPIKDNKCIRVRDGWKFVTEKYEKFGFAPLVNSNHPFKSYGDD